MLDYNAKYKHLESTCYTAGYKKLLLTCRMHTSVTQRGNVTRLFNYMFITADITVKCLLITFAINN